MTITPDEALTKGREFVTNLPGEFELTTPDKMIAAEVCVAAFLMDYSAPPEPEASEEPEGETEAADEKDSEPGPLGPVRHAVCAVSPPDAAYTEAYRTVRGPMVRLGVADGPSRFNVVLTPSDARRFAAGILNAADEADGTDALHFGVGSPLS
ncbi:hypothetical protein [Micromonospora sp. NPDC047730]|uniref:hypothetical protein n=1 Tax=Micromonospora sp. NPDC047730 TaxID=3364253 RepID=UPI00372355A2